MHLKYWDKILRNLVQPCYKLMPSFFNPNWFQLLLSSSWIYCLIIPIVRTSQNSVFHFYYALESKSLLWQQAFSSLFIISEKARKRLVPLTGWFGQAYRRKGERQTSTFALTSQGHKDNNQSYFPDLWSFRH